MMPRFEQLLVWMLGVMRRVGKRVVVRSLRGSLAALFTTLLGTGCVVFPTHVYVPDASAGKPIYERCSLTPQQPAGVEVERPDLLATVSIVQLQGGLVSVQFDIPEGTTVTLRDDTIRIDEKDGTAPRRAPIARINPVAPARIPETPVIQELTLPVDTPMRGGRISIGSRSSDKHYWLAAPLEGARANEIWITLPEVSVDAVTTRFDEIHFIRRPAIGSGRFNC